MVYYAEPEARHILPFRPIPKYTPWVMPDIRGVRLMSFCEFQRLKFEALFSPSGALRYRRHQERDHPELFRWPSTLSTFPLAISNCYGQWKYGCYVTFKWGRFWPWSVGDQSEILLPSWPISYERAPEGHLLMTFVISIESAPLGKLAMGLTPNKIQSPPPFSHMLLESLGWFSSGAEM